MWKARYIYLLLLPFFLWMFVFQYGPLYGVQLAFKKYSAKLGIWGSEWIGLGNFERIFITPAAVRAIRNTFFISIGRILLEFPLPIVLAILIDAMRGKRLKKIYQTIFTFPHFLSWVVVGAIIKNFLASNGAINVLLISLGLDKVDFLTNTPVFVAMLFATANWKTMGWSAIIYMAAIAGIDPELYDAAKVDGASRWRQIWHVTLPCIRSTIAIMFILAIGGIMNAGFDQIFNLRNGVVSKAVDILDTYIYDITFEAVPNYGFSTAVGIFKSAINFILLLIANTTVGKLTGEKLYS